MCGCGDLKYSPKVHSHGDLYYRKSEVLTLLSQYYLKSEVDALLSNLQAQIDACCDGQPSQYDIFWPLATDWEDDSGFGLQFTPIGSPFFEPIGAGFDGSSQYATLQSSLVKFTGSFTAHVAFSAEEYQGLGRDSYLASVYEYGVDNRAWRLGLKPEGEIRFVVSPDGTYDFNTHAATGTSIVPSGETHKATGVFDANAQEMRVYYDGNLETTKAVGFNSVYQSTAPLILAADMQNGAVVQHFPGYIGELRLWNYALTTAEVSAL